MKLVESEWCPKSARQTKMGHLNQELKTGFHYTIHFQIQFVGIEHG